MGSILLISKDILRRDYLSCYGSKLYHTPNIDKLAEEGTVFANCYTPAPSTSMAVTCMFSGLNAYQLDRKDYTEVKPFTQCPTLFSILKDKGYETHVVWPASFMSYTQKYSKVFHESTEVHNLLDVGRVIPKESRAQGNPRASEDDSQFAAIDRYYEEIAGIVNDSTNPVFIWTHLPHVINPRGCYGSDIDLFDKLVGQLAGFFPGDIYLTADHGHMNCEKNITAYGFHVYQGAVKVPLITPRIMDKAVIEEPTSMIQLKNIILEKRICRQEYIYSDTQYYQQPNRKLAIIKGDFKYIYNKKGRSEELYDLSSDPDENVNLLIKDWYDSDRKKKYPLDEIYHYGKWDEAGRAYMELRSEKNRIWRKGGGFYSLLVTAYNIIRPGLSAAFIGLFPRPKAVRGRWGAMARMT